MIEKIGKFNVFLLGYFLINILQSIFTPLIPDEAYYWVYAQHLDWGYFDHPPMVALIIKLGSFVFNDELGVRFVSVVLNAMMSLLIWKLIPDAYKKQKHAELLFFGILLSIPLFQVYSFVTTPDTPLLFSFALYLFALKKQNEKDSFFHALLFGFAAALLIYSKYHGGILIILSIALQPRLLLKRTTYIAGFFALLLVLPHINWLINHDFITFKYHLFQRTDGSFKITQVLEYISGTIGVLNPALLVLFIIFLFKDKKLISKRDTFYFRMFYAFLFFFFFYSFRARIEAHWVAAAYIPLTIVVFNIAVSNEKFQKPLKYTIGIVAMLIFLLRIIPVLNLPLKTPFHTRQKDYYLEIDQLASGRNVVFMNSYQQASKYSFYTKKESFSLNSIYSRKNHYDLLNPENEFNNKSILLVRHYKSSKFDSIKLNSGEFVYYKKIDNYPVFSKLKANLKFDDFSKESTKIELTLENPYNYKIDFNRTDLSYQFALFFNDGKGKIVKPIKLDIQQLSQKEKYIENIELNSHDIPKGTYQLSLVLKTDYLQYMQIGESYQIVKP